MTADPSSTASTDTHRINLDWLVRLRWTMVGLTVVLVGLTHSFTSLSLPLHWLAIPVSVQVLSNLAAWWWGRSRRRVPTALLGGLVALDITLLTAVLYFTGGPLNPFSSMYLVFISLAVLILGPAWQWGLTAWAIVGFGLMFFVHMPLELRAEPPPVVAEDDASTAAKDDSGSDHGEHHMHGAHHMHGGTTSDEPGETHHAHDTADGIGKDVVASAPHQGHDMAGHLQGMWVAFGITAAFIVYFMHRIRGSLAAREEELARTRERSARAEKLMALGTLSAGAAHELATPLSTIAVVAKELEYDLRATERAEALEDVQVIRAQVDRCRDVLFQMSADAGDSLGEVPELIDVNQLVNRALQTLEASRVSVDVRHQGDLRVPPRAFSRALRSVTKNAIMASEADALVRLVVEQQHGWWQIRVEDDGIGMAPDVLSRATEPFFSTRPTGKGMGLGLFLTKTLLEQFDGELRLTSRVGHGTQVLMRLPA